MRLRHTVDHTIETLTRLRGELGKTRAGHEPWDRRDRWLRWWSETDSQLRNLFVDGEIAASLSLSVDKVRDVNLGALPFVVLNRETDVWEERLGRVIGELKALKPFIERPGVIVVPDTSAFLEGEYFTDLNWQEVIGVGVREPVRLVVPVLVVEELDEKKRDRGRVQSRARSVLHRLWELTGGDATLAVAIPGSRPVTVEVMTDGSWHARRPVNDNEIIDRALTASELVGRGVVLAAADYNMLFQASAAGLKTVLVPRPDEVQDGAGDR